MQKEEEKTLYRAVVVFVIENNKVLLAKKTKKIGKGFWSGYGGGIENGETPEEAVVRETSEESGGVIIFKDNLVKVADTYFHNTKEDNTTFVLNVIVYVTNKKEGEPVSTDEMEDPTWFDLDNLPLNQMFPADKFWVPKVLLGKKCVVKASYGPHQSYMIGEPEIQYVDSF